MRWLAWLVVVAACDATPMIEAPSRFHPPFRPIYPLHQFTSLTNVFERPMRAPAYEAYPTPAFLLPAGGPTFWVNPADDVPLQLDTRFSRKDQVSALVDPTSRIAWVREAAGPWYGPFALEL